MFDFLSFFSKIHLAANLAKRNQERHDYESCMTQEHQEETEQPRDAELHDALLENQSMEKKQMEIIAKDQEQQQRTELALQASVRFPAEEAFQQKMKNAEGYARILLERKAKEKRAKEIINESVQENLRWQEEQIKNPCDNGRVAAARLYLRFKSLAMCK